MELPNSNSKYDISISTQELIKELKEAEKTLFDLRFKKATRQSFKPHEIKATKKKVARLKTILRDKFVN
jgi:large subunit ribosomal protein L29